MVSKINDAQIKNQDIKYLQVNLKELAEKSDYFETD